MEYCLGSASDIVEGNYINVLYMWGTAQFASTVLVILTLAIWYAFVVSVSSVAIYCARVSLPCQTHITDYTPPSSGVSLPGLHTHTHTHTHASLINAHLMQNITKLHISLLMQFTGFPYRRKRLVPSYMEQSAWVYDTIIVDISMTLTKEIFLILSWLPKGVKIERFPLCHTTFVNTAK